MHRAGRHHELVREHRHDPGPQQPVARCACESIRLLDRHVHDVVLAVFSGLHVRIFVDDQRAQVAAVEHHDVGRPGLRIEVNAFLHVLDMSYCVV